MYLDTLQIVFYLSITGCTHFTQGQFIIVLFIRERGLERPVSEGCRRESWYTQLHIKGCNIEISEGSVSQNKYFYWLSQFATHLIHCPNIVSKIKGCLLY